MNKAAGRVLMDYCVDRLHLVFNGLSENGEFQVVAQIEWDGEVDVWYVSESDPSGINAAAATIDELVVQMSAAAIDLLEAKPDPGESEDGV